MSPVFPRGPAGIVSPTAVSAEGAYITDLSGKRYLDAAGGAIVVNIGHGDSSVIDALAEQGRKLDYVHGTQFTSEVIEEYVNDLSSVLPFDNPFVYPVSGGSEAVETAFKLARAYHLARGNGDRHKIISRWGSYHGNTRGALDSSGRVPLRAPYLPWLDHSTHVPEVYEYRCPIPSHPLDCGRGHAANLERVILEEGEDTIAAFIAEPIAGASLGAASPTDDYWPAVAEVCRDHGILLIVDEVMTGFGRTGRWFGSDHWNVRPDIMTAGKGCSSGYWPLGLTVASGAVAEAVVEGGFTHGFTYSHHVMGAAVGRAVFARLKGDDLVKASRVKGERLLLMLRDALANRGTVGDVRGRGLMIGVELVRNHATKAPFDRSDRMSERVVAAAKERGLLLYSSTGCADGVSGDILMFGPPFTISDSEMAQLVEITAEAVGTI